MKALPWEIQHKHRVILARARISSPDGASQPHEPGWRAPTEVNPRLARAVLEAAVGECRRLEQVAWARAAEWLLRQQ
jgi:hypothetical protein